VRSKGVMEKCTFCVQRIRGAQHQARMSGAPLRDGDVVTACQQSCPADAIAFGDLNDPNSPVARLISTHPTFRLRQELGTEPSVYYIPPDEETHS